MYLCHIDEAGDGQTLDPAGPDAPPALVVGGLTVHDPCVKQLTCDFLDVKKTYRPQSRRAPHLSEVIHTEIRGSDVRRGVRVGNRDRCRAVVFPVRAARRGRPDGACRCRGRPSSPSPH